MSNGGGARISRIEVHCRRCEQRVTICDQKITPENMERLVREAHQCPAPEEPERRWIADEEPASEAAVQPVYVRFSNLEVD